ncbi:hypothetical protein ACFQ3Z_38180 [Streptomyces nogalater]
MTLRVEHTRVPDGWAAGRSPDLEDIGGRDVMRATRSYSGPSDELTLILAPLERLSAWGMEEVEEGDKLEVVGYPDRDHDDELRPEMIVLENGQTVRQRSVPLPAAPEPLPGRAGRHRPRAEQHRPLVQRPREHDRLAADRRWRAAALPGGGYYVVRRAGRG